MSGIFRRIPASNSHQGETRATRGFTIVELLIVIVVIAILAAIVFVAYNGITGRANAVSAEAAVKEAGDGLATYAATNGGQYPSALSAAGISPSGNTTFQYAYNNSASPATFCVTATTANVSYYEDGASHTTPTAGACPGQAANGGTATTNLLLQPDFSGGWTYVGVNPGGSSSTGALMTSGGYNGAAFVRTTASASLSSALGIWYGNGGTTLSVTAGTAYTASAWVRASKSLSVAAYISWYGSSGQISSAAGSSTGISTSWQRISASGTAPSGATYAILSFYTTTPTVSGDYVDFDALMFTQGSTLYTYGDGSTPGWVWNGSPTTSTSTGPASS